MHEHVLILDYSLDRSATAAMKRWMPAQAEVEALFVDETFRPEMIGDWTRLTHVLHSGSARSIVEPAPFSEAVESLVRAFCRCGIAQMGVCYGHQLLCLALLGAQAVRHSHRGLEAGWRTVEFGEAGRELLGVAPQERVWQHHFDEVVCLPSGAQALAASAHTPIQAFADRERRLLGLQFHPEFDRDAGNCRFIERSAALAEYGYQAETMVRTGPSLATGPVFFGAFFSLFAEHRQPIAPSETLLG
jgi:GMP synthase-like glutamine amidotransferase